MHDLNATPRLAFAPLRGHLLAAPILVAVAVMGAMAACTPGAADSATPSKAENGKDKPKDADADKPKDGGGEKTDVIAQTATDAEGNPVAPSAWEVHEWGVLSIQIGKPDAATMTTGRPTTKAADAKPELLFPPDDSEPDFDRSQPKRKPVLYVHLGKGVERMEFSLSVAPSNGHIVEHWPRVTADGTKDPSISWDKVVASTKACDLAAMAYPSLADSACKTPDGICEVAELATIHTQEGACLEFNGKDYEHLFYRAGLIAPGIPWTLSGNPDGGWLLGATEGAPSGKAVHIKVGSDRSSTKVEIFDLPTTGTPVTVKTEPTGATVEDAATWLRTELVARGLTAEETEAFMRAWEADLLGGTADRARDDTAAADILLIWLDQPLVDGLVPLKFSPEPTKLKRVHLLSFELG